MEHLADPALYSRRVMELFDAPAHAGRPAGVTHVGEAASKPRESRVRICLRVVDGIVETAGFEALGCPHTVAAAELVCEALSGSAVETLTGFDAGFLDTALPLPPEKRDIRILLEDAVRNAAAGER